jgi:carbon-monoxide dehydrogenase small subunit
VHIDGSLVKSCLLLAVQVDGCDVRTIEGVEHGGELDPVQQSFVEEYGVQCGFCTPGMIMATHALLSKNPDPDEDDIRHALSGNICMCTGYVKIVDAVLTAARRMRR